MIDIHSHIIYDIDDGSKGEKMTLNMLTEAYRSGTKKIVATPHFYRGHFDCYFDEANKRLNEIRELAKKNNISIEIYCGQEVYYRENMFEYFTDKFIGTINNSRYMLIELPMGSFSRTEVIDTIYELAIRGIVPILAHPERYRPFIREPRLINKFIREGYLFQLNAGSIAGKFGEDVRKTAEIFAEHKVYNFIGSDAHDDRLRTTSMTEGIVALENIDPFYIEEIQKSSEALLKDEEILFLGKQIEEKKKKRGLFRFFNK